MIPDEFEEHEPLFPAFITTREYKRFPEFCSACKKSCYIGLCHGEPGVGKTISAAHFTGWDIFDMPTRLNLSKFSGPPPDAIVYCRALYYTAPVVNSPPSIYREIGRLRQSLDYVRKRAIENFRRQGKPLKSSILKDGYNILVVDEADRLCTNGFELIRSIHDEERVAVILIGMPGIERRLARHKQLYSRVGFLHQFLPLDEQDVREVIAAQLSRTKLKLDESHQAAEETISSIVRITSGNFRLIDRIFDQITRIAEINRMPIVNSDMVESARSLLIIGS
jgi:hypothetical protein